MSFRAPSPFFARFPLSACPLFVLPADFRRRAQLPRGSGLLSVGWEQLEVPHGFLKNPNEVPHGFLKNPNV